MNQFDEKLVEKGLSYQMYWNYKILTSMYPFNPRLRSVEAENIETVDNDIYLNLLVTINLFSADNDEEYEYLESIRHIGVDDMFKTNVDEYYPASPKSYFKWIRPCNNGFDFDLEFTTLYKTISRIAQKFGKTLECHGFVDMNSGLEHMKSSYGDGSMMVNNANKDLESIITRILDIIEINDLIMLDLDEILEEYAEFDENDNPELYFQMTMFRDVAIDFYQALMEYTLHRLMTMPARNHGYDMKKLLADTSGPGDQILMSVAWQNGFFNEELLDEIHDQYVNDQVPDDIDQMMNCMAQYIYVKK